MKQSNKQRLSVCLIVKNEEQFLGECLESIVGIADQLIVLDTGSTDRTIEIAESFQAEIHHFEWCEDFSAARNASIKYATENWILWLDADERLPANSQRKLVKLLKFEVKPVIYKVRIKNLKEDGINFTLSSAHRLFTNHRGIKFTGRIHEQVSPSAKKVGAAERNCQVMLDHLGYSFSGDQKAKKQARNRKILEEDVREHPESAYTHYTLAHNYKEDGNLTAAEKHYSKALELNQFDSSMQASLLNTYADTLIDLGRLEEARVLTNRSIKLHALQNAAYFLIYKMAKQEKKNAEAIQALQVIQGHQDHLSQSGSGISTDIEVKSSMIWKTLADLFTAEAKWVDAADAYKHCLAEAGPSGVLLKGYFKVLEKLQDWHPALEVLGELIKLEGEIPPYLHAIATILLRIEEYEAALQTFLRLDQIQPNDSTVRRKIASLYARAGELEQAEKWLIPYSPPNAR